jgi:aflatoxin B1 aldehyde reductase
MRNSGKYKSKDIPTEGRYSNTNTNQGNIYRDRYFRDATFDSLQLIEPVIQKHNLTLLETALRWCVHHSALKVMDGNDGVIIGVSSLKQLEGNLSDMGKGPLPEDVVQALDQAWLINKGTAPRYWHQNPPKA